ncbi:MAG: thiamine-phosphate kinase, partial [Gemmatimonadaceae bacterium]
FSDLAAMGGTTNAILVSLIVPVIWREHVREFSAGIKATVAAHDARIVGGNISRGSTFSCTLTVIGYSANPVRRSGAQVGDALYVTGKLGGPATAVSAWERGEHPPAWAKQRFVHPTARVREGQWLAAEGARAMIDVSDGLAVDSQHLGAASGAQCVLRPELVPRFDTVSPQDALTAGEEYELLVALPANRANDIAARFRREFEVELTLVGVVETAQDSAQRVELPAGHDHFSSR